MYLKKMVFSTLLSVSGSLLIIGCGGGGSSGEKFSNSNTIKGKLIDSAVEGARYICDGGKKNAFTNKDGLFECSSLPIDFFIGQLHLGQVKTLPSDKEIHIQDIVGVDRTSTNNPQVMKIARLLQSLDNDQNPKNGIKILETKNSLFKRDIEIDNFNLEELVKIDSSIERLVSEESVLAHLDNSTDIEDSTSDPEYDDMVWNVSNIQEFRQALEDSSLNGKNDRIILNTGIYKTTSDGLGTFTFDDNEAFNLTIESAKGLTYSDVILDGNTTQQVFNFNNSNNVTLTLKGISIINGKTVSKGGGIYCKNNIKIKDCNISNNIVSSGSGGGFYATGTTTIINSTISNNRSVIHSENFEDSNGGGFYSNGETTITDSTISNNNCRANSSFENSNGGGFYSASSTTIRNSTISNNNSSARFSNSESNGGGFYSRGTTNIINSTISNNNINRAKFSYSHNHGAGFYVKSTAILINSLISNNSGPIVTYDSYSKATIGTSFYSSNAYISNNNIIGNKGSIATQGIFVNNIFDSNDEDITLIGESKIYNNYIDYSKIVDNNYNVIKKKNLQSTSVGDVYLTNNYTLESESPVIDKGLNPSSATFKKIIGNDDIYNQMLELLKTDKIGNKRIHNGTIDMGAVEYGSSK